MSSEVRFARRTHSSARDLYPLMLYGIHTTLFGFVGARLFHIVQRSRLIQIKALTDSPCISFFMDNNASADGHARPQVSLYDLIGGETGVRRLVERFYDIMDTDPTAIDLRALHAPDLAPMRQTLFEFMSGWLGGPRLYRRCVMSAHRPFSIGEKERDQWLACMRRAMADSGVSREVRDLLEKPLFSMADFMRNH